MSASTSLNDAPPGVPSTRKEYTAVLPLNFKCARADSRMSLLMRLRSTAKRTHFFGTATKIDCFLDCSKTVKEIQAPSTLRPLNGQPVAAFLTPSPENRSAILRSHFTSKPVRSFTLNIRFIRQCLFHRRRMLQHMNPQSQEVKILVENYPPPCYNSTYLFIPAVVFLSCG